MELVQFSPSQPRPQIHSTVLSNFQKILPEIMLILNIELNIFLAFFEKKIDLRKIFITLGNFADVICI